jgi:hypothetical protein
LFLIPLILLEPIKPLSAYFVASGQFKLGMLVLIVGEILKNYDWDVAFLPCPGESQERFPSPYLVGAGHNEVAQMPIIRMVRRPPNYSPQCGGSFRLKAKVPRVSQRSEAHYLQCFDCKQIAVCNYKTQRAGLAEQVA